MMYALMSFLGAFLLFFVQPYLGKVLTPGLGGGSQVWITCMLFFQACLLAGYAYAHFLVTRVRPHFQRWFHALVLVTCALILLLQWFQLGAPFHPGLPALDSQKEITLPLLMHLLLRMGLPLMALSATSPLIQAWFTRTRPTENPYRLYAASNLGSLLGLLAYPFAAERFLTLPTQGWLLMGLFLGLLLLPFLAPKASLPEMTPERQAEGRTTLKEVAQWIATSAGGSLVLMAGSTYLSTEVAAIPMLWVLPLALYLITFILLFETPLARFERSLVAMSGALMAVFYSLLLIQTTDPTPWMVITGCLGLVFFGSLACHGCLYVLRPPSDRLTAFYLSMATGGVLGGVFVALLAPLIYDRLSEVPVSVVLAGAIGMFWATRIQRPLARFVAILPLIATLTGLLGGALLVFRPGEWRRDFYGTVQVLRIGRVQAMLHGRTLHGAVRLDNPTDPMTYFHPESGVARALSVLRERHSKLKVGVVGLGVGSLASYGRSGDHFVFYEISPVVLELAGLNGKAFPLLRMSPAQVETVAGDARLSLQRELHEKGSRSFDLLVLDAFSSDAVPWHLLTVEALQLYLSHLAPNGILALHISTPLPLDRVVCTGARALDLYGLLMILNAPPSPDMDLKRWRLTNHYALLARQKAALDDPRLLSAAALSFGPRTYRGLNEMSASVPYLRHGRPWTDAQSSLSDLLLEKRTLVRR